MKTINTGLLKNNGRDGEVFAFGAYQKDFFVAAPTNIGHMDMGKGF